ncbi:MAG: PAS domain-containing protein [Desulfobaccales bacterium]
MELLQELAHLQKRLARTEKIARLGHWCLNLNSPTRYWSEEVFRLFGKDAGTFAPSQAALIESLHPEDQEPLLELINNSLNCQNEFSMDYRILRPDGSLRYLHQRTEVIRDTSGVPRRLFGTVQDITERKKHASPSTLSPAKAPGWRSK